MDAERFGRALGRGVRAAGKAVLEAADAAATPSPSQPTTPRQPVTSGRGTRASVPRHTPVPLPSSGNLRQSARRFGQSVWTPAARAGGVLWHEVTGSFFALFALAAAIEIWRHRQDFTPAHSGGGRVWFAVAMLAVFGWFAVSSFLRAHRRARR